MTTASKVRSTVTDPIRFRPPPGKHPITRDDPGDQTSSIDL